MTASRLLCLGLAPYAIWLVLAYDYHFLDGVNLVFHEAGHLILTPFGQTAHILGGTLLQLSMPLACAGHFVREGKRVEPWICVIWFGESLMYTAWYMADAVSMSLPLAGGGEIHDWNWLLTRSGLLRYTDALSTATHVLASAVVVGALALAFRASGEQAGKPQATQAG